MGQAWRTALIAARAELTTTAARMKQLAQGAPVVERYPTRYAPGLVVI